MHHTCATLNKKGRLVCPICRTDEECGTVAAEEQGAMRRLQDAAEEAEEELPFWHEAEVGAPNRRPKKNKTKVMPCRRNLDFPMGRWPTEDEARAYGYGSVKAWYFDFREGLESNLESPASKEQLEAEFREMKAAKTEQAPVEDPRVTRETAACTEQADVLLNVTEEQQRCGTRLMKPYNVADGPESWKRVQNATSQRQLLELAVQEKWREATTGPPEYLKCSRDVM